jgi:WD40 repeat protein
VLGKADRVLRSIAFSPDGEKLALGSDGQVTLFDVRSGAKTATDSLRDSIGEVTCIAFSADGRKLLAGGEKGRILIWEVGQYGVLKKVNELKPLSNPVRSMVLNDDNKFLLSAGESGKLVYSDLETKEVLSQVDYKKRLLGAALLSDGHTALALLEDSVLRFKVPSGKVEREIHASKPIAISADGTRIASAENDGFLILDMENGLTLAKLEDRENNGPALFSPDGKCFFAAARGKVNIWDVESGKRIATLHPSGNNGDLLLALSRDGRTLATVRAWGGELNLFEPVDRQQQGARIAIAPATGGSAAPLVVATAAVDWRTTKVQTLMNDIGWSVKCLRFSPDGKRLAVGKQEHALLLFDLASGAKTVVDDGLNSMDSITCVTFTPDGKKLLAGGSSGEVFIWEIDEGGLTHRAGQFVGHTAEIRTIAVSADSRFALSGGHDKRARYWQIDRGREIATVSDFKEDVTGCALLSDGKTASATDGEKLIEFNASDGAVLRQYTLGRRHPNYVAAYNADASRVACAESEGITVWDTKTGVQLSQVEKRYDQGAIAFSPDGSRLFTGATGRVNVWDWAAAKRVATVRMPLDYVVRSIAISPDGLALSAIPDSSSQPLQIYRGEPIPSGGLPQPPSVLQGKLYLACKGECELILDGEKLPIVRQTDLPAFSEPVPAKLHVGSHLIVRARGADMYRAFRLEFVSDDGRWVWPASPDQFRTLSEEAVDKIDESVYSSSIDRTPSIHKTSPGITAAWNDLRLPASDQSEWMWTGGRSAERWSPFGAVLEPGWFIEVRDQWTAPAAAHLHSEPPQKAAVFEGHHYKVFFETGISWSEAKIACEEMGGHLACPKTQGQRSLLAGLKNGLSMWLGGRCLDGGASWQWINGGEIDFHEPTERDRVANCLATIAGPASGFDAWANDGLPRDENGKEISPSEPPGARFMREDPRIAIARMQSAENAKIRGYICEWDY